MVFGRHGDNGHGQTATKGRRPVFGDPTNFDEQFSNVEGAEGPLHNLVDPGDDPRALLMRTRFRSERQAVAAARLLAKCREFHIDWGCDMARDLFAALRSVDGLSCNQLLQGYTGVLVEGMNRPGRRREDQRDQDRDDRR